MRTDWFYDLYVTGEEHYLAQGLWHHNTGKSFSAGWWFHSALDLNPGWRGLICRKNRVDMSESVLVTMEEEVMGPGHPAISGTAQRPQRRAYNYPNRSHAVVAGMNNPRAVLSAQYNVALLEEAKEFNREDYELVSGRMRNTLNTGGPPERMVLVTNPGPQWHWLNLAATDGLFERLLSRHCHNPRFYDVKTGWTEQAHRYLGRIRRSFTGERFAQYVKGEWADASGRVYPMYDPATHLLEAEQVWDGPRLFLRREVMCVTRDTEIMWTAAGVDWGFAVPGTIQVWGWDKEGTAYLLAEVYKCRKDPVWWTEKMVELNREYKLRRIICDSAEPDRIYMFNRYLGETGKQEGDRIAIRCEKGRDANLAHLQSLMLPLKGNINNVRGSRVYLLKDTIRYGKDEEHSGKGLPCCLHDELLYLMYDQNEADKPIRERVDPTQHNHASDAAQYIHRWASGRDLAVSAEKRPIVPGSFADILGHRAKLEALQQMRQR